MESKYLEILKLIREHLLELIKIDSTWLKQEYEDTIRLTPGIARHEGRIEAWNQVLEMIGDLPFEI